MEQIAEFFQHPFFSIVGGIATSVLIAGILYRVIFWFLDITPIVLRFGLALRNRNLGICGSLEAYSSLKMTIEESGVFKPQNIHHVPIEAIEKAKGKSILLVDWASCGESIERFYQLRDSHQTAMIIFAKAGSIQNEQMADVANRPNTVVVNARGRLLNDILTSLVTTSYER